MNRILVTGADGLVGTALCRRLEVAGHDLVRIDLQPRHHQTLACDVLDLHTLRARATRCTGIIHLAAVSRVVWGEADPEACLRTNVLGTAHIADIAASSPAAPWVVFASSREVYGRSRDLPVAETYPPAPINVYGRSKLFAERVVQSLDQVGRRGAIVRLSSVYGSAVDHHDRVIPAFCRAALTGHRLRVNGAACTFDFTHVDDVAGGIMRIVQRLAAGGTLAEPIHLVSGIATSLGELAALIIRRAGSNSVAIEQPPRSYDVSHFVGDPTRASAVLSWRAAIGLEQGVAQLLADLAQQRSNGSAAEQDGSSASSLAFSPDAGPA